MSEENYYSSANNEESGGFNLSQLFFWFLSNWYWFVISLAITLGIAAFYFISTMPTYTRYISVLIKPDDSQSLSSDFGRFADMSMTNARVNTMNEMLSLKSPAYMKDVVKGLHLDMDYQVDGPFHRWVLYGSMNPVEVSLPDLSEDDYASFTMELEDDGTAKLSHFSLNGESKSDKSYKLRFNTLSNTPIGKMLLTPTTTYDGKYDKPIYVTRSRVQDKVNSYVARLSVDLVENRSTVIDCRLDDASGERAEDVLNKLYEVYNQKGMEDVNLQAVNSSKFIDEELAKIESELGNVDSDISSYKSQNLVPDVQAASNIYMQRSESTNSQLLDLNNQLHMAEYIRKQLSGNASKYEVLPPNSGIDNRAIEQQIATYNETVLQRNRLVANSSASNPLVQELDQSISAMRQAIVTSLDNIIASLRAQVGSLRGSESQTKSQIAANPSQEKYILSVERQQKVKEQIYIFLLQKREETQLSKAYSSNAKLLNPPSGPRKATKPVKFNLIMMALLAGILIPLALLLIYYNLDNAVHGRRDLESLTIPFIGEVPLSYRKRGGLLGLFNRHKDTREIVVQEKSGNLINEAFRVVRTNVEFVSGKDADGKVIMFTSANPNSGKTFVAINLAKSFSIKGRRTLVVDLDLRKASLSSFVGSPSIGVSNYLSERVDDLDSLLVKGTISENLDVLPVGTIPPNPTELLFTKRFETMMLTMRQQYDYVFIDCPPVDILADASIINKFCDMTIYVIRVELYDKRMLPELQRTYEDKRYKNLVLLLNGVYDNGHGYGYGRYGYGYGFGYGYGYGRGYGRGYGYGYGYGYGHENDKKKKKKNIKNDINGDDAESSVKS